MLKTIIKNSLSLFSSQIITRLFAFSATVILSRYFGVEKFGQYSFILAFVALFSIVADLGISQLVIREVSKDKTQSQRYLANFFVIQIILSILTFVFIVIAINVLGYDSEVKKLVYIAGLGTITLSLGMPFSAIINAYQKMYYGAIANIISTSVNTGLIIILVFFKQGLASILGILAITNLLNSFLVYRFFKKFQVPSSKFQGLLDKKLIKFLLWSALPFALLMGFNTIYNRIDMTMLSKMQGNEAVGYYSAAYRLINFLSFIPLSFSAAIFPILSRTRLGKNSKENDSPNESLSYFIPQSLKYIIAIGLPVAAGVSILSTPIIILFYGQDYLPGSEALRVLVWMVAILCFYSVVTHTLVAIGKVAALALANGLGVIVNIGLNFIFIPRWGFVGASWTTIISEAVLLIASYYLAHHYIKYKEPFPAITKVIIATLAMSVVVFLLQKSGVYFIISASTGAIVYVGTLWIAGFINQEEKQVISKMFNRA